MTCVAGIVKKDGRSWIAGDAFAGSADEYRVTNTPKIARIKSGTMIGFAGLFRSGQLIFDAWMAHPEWSVWDFSREFVIEDSEWCLLVISEGKMYEVQGDLSVMEIGGEKCGSVFHAIGSGSASALGALARDHRDDVSLIEALDISSRFSPSVRGPFSILETKVR